MIYNYQKIEYPNGQTQHRLYTVPVQVDTFAKDCAEWVAIEIEKEEKVVRVKRKEEDISQEDKERSKAVSVNRSKNKLIELARSNDWQWFATFTFRSEEGARYDFDECRKRVTKFFNNLRSRKCPDIKYLGVPEQHKDGAWHFHVLISNIDEIKGNFTAHFVDGVAIKGVYRMNGAWPYGFDTISMVQDSRRVCGYITKYITKDMITTTKGKQRYFHSNNLVEPVKSYYQLNEEEMSDNRFKLICESNFFKTVAFSDDVHNTCQQVQYFETE